MFTINLEDGREAPSKASQGQDTLKSRMSKYLLNNFHCSLDFSKSSSLDHSKPNRWTKLATFLWEPINTPRVTYAKQILKNLFHRVGNLMTSHQARVNGESNYELVGKRGRRPLQLGNNKYEILQIFLFLYHTVIVSTYCASVFNQISLHLQIEIKNNLGTILSSLNIFINNKI